MNFKISQKNIMVHTRSQECNLKVSERVNDEIFEKQMSFHDVLKYYCMVNHLITKLQVSRVNSKKSIMQVYKRICTGG